MNNCEPIRLKYMKNGEEGENLILNFYWFITLRKTHILMTFPCFDHV